MSSSRPRKFALTIGFLLIACDLTLAVKVQRGSVAAIAETTASHSLIDFVPDLPIREPQTVKTEGVHAGPSLTDLERELCHIKKSSSIPLDGEIRLQTTLPTDGAKNFWIKSSSCPDELYSIVKIDREGRIEKEISCHNTNLTEVTLNSGLQFNVDTAAPDPAFRSVALSGPGRFLVNCLDDYLTLTRDGRFNQEAQVLINAEGCTAWTRKDGGRAVRLTKDEKIDERGCSISSGECFDIAEVDERDSEAFNFRTKNSLTVINERALRTARDTTVFPDALEDLDSHDRSLTGVALWENIPVTPMPATCPE